MRDNRQNNNKLLPDQFVCGCSGESIDKKISPRSPQKKRKSSISCSNQNLKVNKNFIVNKNAKNLNDLPQINPQFNVRY